MPDRLRVAALRYERSTDQLPHVVAKGEGHIAEKILALAREHGIPIHEDPGLVDVLAGLDLDTAIPPEIYQVVAEILAFLYRVQQAGLPRSTTTWPPAPSDQRELP